MDSTTTCCSGGSGLNMDDGLARVYQLLSGDVAAAFFDAVQAHARAAGLLANTSPWMGRSWKRPAKSWFDAAESPARDPGNPTVNFHERRRNVSTHVVSGVRPRVRPTACRQRLRDPRECCCWRPARAQGLRCGRRASRNAPRGSGECDRRSDHDAGYAAETKTRGTGVRRRPAQLRLRGIALVD